MADTLKPKLLRETVADMALVESIKKDTGLTVDTEVYRAGLRAYRRELDAIPAALAIVGKKTTRAPRKS